jgi:tetratricopeptide (TPR) repeat protein
MVAGLHLLLCVCLIVFGATISSGKPVEAAEALAAGKRAYVNYLTIDPVPLHKAADEKSAILTQIIPGTPLMISNGPVKSGSMTWWYVSAAMYGSGWIMGSVNVNGQAVGTLVLATTTRYNSIIKLLADVIKKKPTADAYDAIGLADFGLSRLGTNSRDDAVNAFAKAVELDPTKAWFHAHKAMALYEVNKYSVALDSINEAIKLNAQEIAFLHIRSAIHYAAEQYVEAFNDAISAGKLNSQYLTALFDQAIATERGISSGGPSATILAQQIVSADPLFSDAWRILARDAAKKQDVQKAREYFQKAIDATPALSQPYISRAYYYIDYEGDFVHAESDIKQAMALDPLDSRAYGVMAYYLVKANADFQEAARLYQQAIKYSPFTVSNYLDVSDLYLELSEWDSALATAKQAIIVSPDLPCACGYLRLGDAYYGKGDYKNAIDAYNKYLSLAEQIDTRTLEMIQERLAKMKG